MTALKYIVRWGSRGSYRVRDVMPPSESDTAESRRYWRTLALSDRVALGKLRKEHRQIRATLHNDEQKLLKDAWGRALLEEVESLEPEAAYSEIIYALTVGDVGDVYEEDGSDWDALTGAQRDTYISSVKKSIAIWAGDSAYNWHDAIKDALDDTEL